MHKLKLKIISEELDRDIYDISLTLKEGLSVRVRQESLSEFPRNDLEVVHSGRTYAIPIFMRGFPLKDSHHSLEQAVNGDVNVLVTTPEKVKEQSNKEMEAGKSYVTLTLDSHRTLTGQESAEETTSC